MKDSLSNYLTSNELSGLLSLSYESLRCSTEDQFKNLVLDLKILCGLENAFCTQATVPDTFLDRNAVVDVLNISYPFGFVDIYFENRYHLNDKVMRSAMANLAPVNWQSNKRQFGADPSILLASDYNMKDGWALCTVDPVSKCCTLFFIAGSVIDNSIRALKIIEYIVPFFSLAYTRVLRNTRLTACNLTQKEIEVLNWIKEGKSSWEISLILNRSKRVVDFHTSNIKIKLDALSRAQCVAKGIERGIIDL